MTDDPANENPPELPGPTEPEPQPLISDIPADYRAGFITILGKPNAGKSTLFNALTGMHLAAISDKPQTTRDRIHGIVSGDKWQMVFVDTPGVIVPKDTDRFNEVLMQRAEEGHDEVDVVIHLIDACDTEPVNDRLAALLKRIRRAKILLVINKTDLGRIPAPDEQGLVHPAAVPGVRYDQVLKISALKRYGVDKLVETVRAELPLSPPYYDPDQPTDRDERFLVTELVREKIFRHLGREVPYAVFVDVVEFREAASEADKDFISLIIYVERESQKPILIGAGGLMLRKIGAEARRDIEELTGRPAFLELRVKVRKEWRRNPADLGFFGFKGRRSSPTTQSKKSKRK